MTVYLDHAASSPMRPEVLEQMLPHLTGVQANPSSPHAPGRRARMALDEAHERLARTIGAEPRAIVFTAGGTEAINLAVKGAAWAGKAEGHRIVTSATEHKAVLESCLLLEKYGFEITRLPVDRYGQVDPDDLTAALDEKTVLVSLQLANNEVGTIQPIDELIGRVRSASRARVHVDAVQAAAWLSVDVAALDADLVSFAAHKVEGPKGMGALWVRRATAILPQLHGGSQERYRRAGTENVAGAVGMAAAFELATAERETVVPAVSARRDRLRDALLALEDVELTGHGVERLPNSLSLVVRDVSGDDLVIALDLEDIACSTGSACTSGSAEPSHVLSAMGYPPAEARGALRISLGRTTSDEDIEAVLRVLPAAIERLRAGGARLRLADGAGEPAA
ncbi:MAG TPA: cysteine desulfurase family protein [Anaerolineae bacterium]|nr:cysteine desulfurase family protein [Anaerolineae bacterium]